MNRWIISWVILLLVTCNRHADKTPQVFVEKVQHSFEDPGANVIRNLVWDGKTWRFLDFDAHQFGRLYPDTREIQWFSRKGEGPGELMLESALVSSSLWVEGQQTHVLHAGGSRFDVFDADGQTLVSEKISDGLTIFKNGNLQIATKRPENLIKWRKDGKEEVFEFVSTEGLDHAVYYISVNQPPFTYIATRNAIRGKIHFMVFHHQQGLWDRGEFPVMLHVKKSDYPKLPPDMIFQPSAIYGISSNGKQVFLTERPFKVHPGQAKFQALHIYDLDNNQHQHYKVINGPLPLLDLMTSSGLSSWLGFDRVESKFYEFSMDLPSTLAGDGGNLVVEPKQ